MGIGVTEQIACGTTITTVTINAMLWEGKPLREVRADEIRGLVQSALAEHLQLDYKSALYEDGDRGRREFLLDICMFANSNGGILLLGVPEQRGEDDQPTGIPDADGVLGLEIGNPQAILAAYDARVMEAIEERLSIESTSIDMGAGRWVLAIRVPNSANKPHSVRHQGHIYFPSRRERQRYHLTVREIKELIMRTASHLQQAEELLKAEFDKTLQPPPEPHLIIGMIPIFFEEFQIDVRNDNVRMAVGRFSRVGGGDIINPTYTFNGIERFQNRLAYTVRLQRNGLLSSVQDLPRIPRADAGHQIGPTGIDQLLRQFVLSASAVYDASGIGPPYVLGMMISLSTALTGVYAALGGYGEHHSEPVPPGTYRFPFTQVDDLANVDRIIKPLCDQTHQMFGEESSPSFDAAGVWRRR